MRVVQEEYVHCQVEGAGACRVNVDVQPDTAWPCYAPLGSEGGDTGGTAIRWYSD